MVATEELPGVETKSTHRVEVVPVRLEKHPNADSLSVAKVFGYCAVVKSSDWRDGQLAAYIPPDSLVDVRRSEFTFLADQAKADCKARIKAKKLRGVVSFGLLVPAPEGAKEGDDVAAQLFVEHYEPPAVGEHNSRAGIFMGGEVAKGPDVPNVKYDVDAFRRYHHLFVAGEPVVVTEKLDGSSARFVYHDGRFHCGSRNEWKKEFPDYAHVTVGFLTSQGMEEAKAQELNDKLHAKPKKRNLWWEILDATPALQKFCQDNPGVVVYGEIFGMTNCIKYCLPEGNRFAGFDVMKDGQWLNAFDARHQLQEAGVPQVPLLSADWPCTLPYDFDAVCALAEGQTTVPGAKPGTLREGCVIKPVQERRDPHVGRVCFKAVGGGFLERYR